MAVDNWTINLECDGKAEGQKHVQRQMDRDRICFFDLIDMIEGSGYTSVDYLYYKRKDSLVVIEQDSDVMKMLNESRNGGYCPIGAKDWREVKKNNAETIIQFVQVRRCPDDIDEDQWKALVKYWKFSEGQNLSEKNKISHEMKKTTHIAGTKSYARWSEDMGYYARSDYNNSQNQAVLSKRKRVYCVAPNQNDGFLKHMDELNKETCDSEYSDDDNLLLSTTSRTTKKQKGHHGGPGETTTIAHQEVAHDKATCYQPQTPKQLPLMKAGSMVLLMTSKYANMVNVAYATLFSTDPETIVGGVKTRSQFYKVEMING
ncbi:unnamed protein product [Miscanthus lutarioriparius]|uniref:PB1-like domain-containing protein n=1 Tax=Miscanthus lutarioriparius TaxID=422564 RepID=A0A811MH67_9POAL|nr:unnamed protein product [Miscanthus lutarioriparius]